MRIIGEYLSKLLAIVGFYILAMAFVPKLYIGLFTALVLIVIFYRTLNALDIWWTK